MTRTQIINRLINIGLIRRERVNRYAISNDHLAVTGYNFGTRQFTRDVIIGFFAHQGGSGESDWYVNVGARPSAAADAYRRDLNDIPFCATSVPLHVESPRQPEVLRTIYRGSYHSHGSGTDRDGVQEALRSIAPDADGVKRSYGLEWEIYRLNSQQEDKLARLLDTLPTHHTERDGSLCDSGVEIIFMPMTKVQYIATFNALQGFCRENNIDMNNTGAHTTFGVSSSQVDMNDLQIRLNRIALAVKACSTQRAIKNVFGRDFTNYARLPQSTTYREHSNAWSTSRGNSAYELRLVNWQADVNKVVEFLEATEFVFTRPFTANDFMRIFRVMGSDVSEA